MSLVVLSFLSKVDVDMGRATNSGAPPWLWMLTRFRLPAPPPIYVCRETRGAGRLRYWWV